MCGINRKQVLERVEGISIKVQTLEYR